MALNRSSLAGTILASAKNSGERAAKSQPWLSMFFARFGASHVIVEKCIYEYQIADNKTVYTKKAVA